MEDYIRCANCAWEGEEDELIMDHFIKDIWFQHCPDCNGTEFIDVGEEGISVFVNEQPEKEE